MNDTEISRKFDFRFIYDKTLIELEIKSSHIWRTKSRLWQEFTLLSDG